MFEISSHPLNPNANCFVPKKSETTDEMSQKLVSELVEKKKAKGKTVANRDSNVSSKKCESIKGMALKCVKKLFMKKKAMGETTVTNEELAKLIGYLISISYMDRPESERLNIQTYLNDTILSSKYPAVMSVSDSLEIIKQKKSSRRYEYFKTPNFPKTVYSLLVAFWGLYRHEQAQRPLLSLTYRPNGLKDDVWSINAPDKKLWNPSCTLLVCRCPPMFGYSIPSNFFGDLFHYSYDCPVQKIHLNHYAENAEGNEFILADNRQHYLVYEQPFEDISVNLDITIDIHCLSNHFKTIVSEICSSLSKFSEDVESKTVDVESKTVDVESKTVDVESKTVDDEEEVNNNGPTVKKYDYFSSLWNDADSKISHVPFFQQKRDCLVDDNDHPLLEMSHVCLEEDEVPLEIKEMLRRCLSPKTDTVNKNSFDIQDFSDIKDLNEKKGITCDPPCSVWCDSIHKESNVEVDCSLSVKDSENLEDAPVIDLISLDKDPEEKEEPVKISPMPNFQKDRTWQSFSDDCDPFYSGTSFGVTAHASNLTPNNEFNFLKNDPNVFKAFYGSGSLEGRDSGFVSRSSSEEDIFEGYCEHGANESTWKYVTGEDSLWMPLPECIVTNDRNLSYKQPRNYRRQKPVT